MNNKQRIVLFATAVLLIVMLIFPPFESVYLQGVTVNAGYSFVLKPPIYELSTLRVKSRVNVGLLGLQFLIVVAAGSALYIALKSK